jgi:hypothetical protein
MSYIPVAPLHPDWKVRSSIEMIMNKKKRQRRMMATAVVGGGVFESARHGSARGKDQLQQQRRKS